MLRLKKWLAGLASNTSLSRKYIYSNVVIILIPCLILSAAYFLRFQKSIQNEISLSFEQVMSQYVANITYKLDLYRNIEEAFSVNSRIQEILANQNAVTPIEIARLIDDFSKETRSIFLGKNQGEVYNITLYTYNENFSYDGSFLRSIKFAKNEEWFIQAEKSKNYYNCYLQTQPQSKQALLLMSQPIVSINSASSAQRLGIIQISLYVNQIFKPTNTMSNNKDMEVFILDQQGKILYGNSAKSGSLQKILKDNRGNGIIEDSNTNKIFISRNITDYNWKAVALFPYNEVSSKVNGFVVFSIMSVIIILIISFGMTFSFSNIFTKRIHLLVEKMKKVEAGDLNIITLIEGKDEVGLLDKHFNSMTNRLKSLISENYIQRLEKREAELSALQLQINPHFLYNTLESISAIAAINNCFEICSVSKTLGDMFRYNINTAKKEFVFLREEINHIKNYVFIQKIRFEDRFEVFYNIPDDLMNCRILKFILQPIVENAFSHGIEGKPGKGRILISAVVREKVLYLTVEDDGVGMTQEKVEQMNARFGETEISTDQKEHVKRSIGLKNVDSRIKMVNGNAYGVTVKSQLSVGTSVVIALPYYNENKDDVHV